MIASSVCRGAVFFDVDGTLVARTSSSQHLASYLGHREDLAAAELSYAKGEFDNRDVSILDAAGWRGHHIDDVTTWLDDLPLVEGVQEVVAWCRDRSLAPCLATLAWQPVGHYLCAKFGFEGSCGPRLSTAHGVFTGEVATHLDELGKRDYALGVAAAIGLAPRQCAAVGDSRSDLALFARVGFSVAFNADGAAKDAADVNIDGDDLRAILPALGSWLTRI